MTTVNEIQPIVMNDKVYGHWIGNKLELNWEAYLLPIPEFIQLLKEANVPVGEMFIVADKYLKLRSEGAPERAVLQRLWGNASLTYPTGFKPLDDMLGGGLHAGLTVIAAPPGRGKSTLALQIGRSLSKQGFGTIYICNDMADSELMAKMMSGISYELTKGKGGWTARDILSGEEHLRENAAFQKVASLYLTETKHLFIETGHAARDVDALGYLIDGYAALFAASPTYEHPPVIILDYLQNVQVDGKGSEREQVNAVVRMLQGKIEQHGIPVLAISSVSRDKYGQPLRLDSLKESGLIEYATSVAIALQFRAVHSEGYDEKKERSKPEQHMELYILKERFGETEHSLPVTFIPKYSTFLFNGVIHKSKPSAKIPKVKGIGAG